MHSNSPAPVLQPSDEDDLFTSGPLRASLLEATGLGGAGCTVRGLQVFVAECGDLLPALPVLVRNGQVSAVQVPLTQ